MHEASKWEGTDVAPMEGVARELGLLLRALKELHHGVLADVGVRLEMPAAAVLTTLDDRGRSRLSTLADVLHVDLSSVSRQVAALEREGWLSRERDPLDSRASLVDLTAAGREVLHRVRAARVAHLRRLLPQWSDEDLGHFAEQLHRFRTDLAVATDLAAHADLADPHEPTASEHPRTRTASPRPTDRTPALAGQEI